MESEKEKSETNELSLTERSGWEEGKRSRRYPAHTYSLSGDLIIGKEL